MKVVPLNRLEYYKILGVGIILFGPLFFSVEMFKTITEKKKEKCPVQLGQRRPQCTAQGGPAQPHGSLRAHVRFLNLTGGARGSVAQRRGREVRG